jgi:YihY family inner membrane protein
MTTAMAQVERGSNRIYGIRRDRKALYKYGRAAVLTAILAVPVGIGFVLLVAGGAFGDAMVAEYGWTSGAHRTWEVLRWPAGLVLLVTAIAVLLDHAPRRRQPALSWLALGAGVAVSLSVLAAAALSLYVKVSGSFGNTYGPLAGIVALLVWSLMSAVSFFYGVAVCAQLEALRADEPEPAEPDPGRPHQRAVSSSQAGSGGMEP